MPEILFTQEDVTRWRYNCLDTHYTLEVAQNLKQVITSREDKFVNFHEFQQHHVAPALIAMMNKGVKVDLEKKNELSKQLTFLMENVEKKLNYLLDEPFNPRSVNQMKAVFKDLLKVKLKVDKKSKSESCASPYMFQYLDEYPEYRVLISLILEYRSIGVFLKTFVNAQVDPDGRMRTSYNCAGTKTYRLSSRKNGFGTGCNMANIPAKGKIKLKYALVELEEEELEDTFIDEEVEGLTALPNCKEFFIPDDGYIFWNSDLSGADAMIMAWASDCAFLQNFFLTSKQKLYIYIANHYLQREITTSSPEYKIFKQFLHLTNYGGMEEKAALSAGIPIKDAKQIRQWYFQQCPEIPEYHKQVAANIKSKGYVENIFGARGWFLNKDCPTLLNQALAWRPQSEIAILINKGLVNIHENEPDIQVLLQIHDALAGQYPVTSKDAPDRIKSRMLIELPYEKPLTIPVDYSESLVSYGGCK